MSANLNAKGGIAPFTGAGPLPTTPPMPGQTAAPASTPPMPGTSQAPSGAQWVGSYFPGLKTGFDASTGMGSIIGYPGGDLSFNTKNYPVVNGQTMMTEAQAADLASAPYDPNSGVNQAGLNSFMGQMQAAMSPYESALKAQEQQQGTFYNDLANSQVNQAQAAGDTARNNLQTDEGNQWQSAAGQGRGALDSYEQSKVSKDYAPQFESLEQNQAASIGNIRLQASQAIQALQSQGLTEDAQNLSSLTEQGIGWLQTTASATQQERDAVTNRLTQEAQNATQNKQFEESQAQQQAQFEQSQQQQQNQFMYPQTHMSPYDQAYINMQTGKDSPTQQKQQAAQQMGSAQSDISKTIYALRAKGQSSDQAVQTVVANIMQNAGQYTAEGIDPNMLINYVYQMAGMPAPYKGATADQAPTSGAGYNY